MPEPLHYEPRIVAALTATGEAMTIGALAKALKCSRTSIDSALSRMGGQIEITRVYNMRIVGLQGQATTSATAELLGNVENRTKLRDAARRARVEKQPRLMGEDLPPEPSEAVKRLPTTHGTTLIRFGKTFKCGKGQSARNSHGYASALAYAQGATL